MRFHVSTELILHKLQDHSPPTISTHLNDLMDNETVHVSDKDYDYSFMVTTTYQRKRKTCVKTELVSVEENGPARIETSDSPIDSEYFYGWPVSALIQPNRTNSSDTPAFKNYTDSGISMKESLNSTDFQYLDVKPTLPIQPNSCLVCGRSFDKKTYLKTHMLTHMPIRPRFSCDICDKSFITKTYIKLHKEKSCKGRNKKHPAVIKNDPVKPHKCEICRKKFRVKNHLRLYIYVA